VYGLNFSGFGKGIFKEPKTDFVLGGPPFYPPLTSVGGTNILPMDNGYMIAVDQGVGLLFVANASLPGDGLQSVLTCKLDGSSPAYIWNGSYPYWARGLCVDTVLQKVYVYVEDFSGPTNASYILSMNYDGSGVTTLLDVAYATMVWMACDSATGLVFISCSQTGSPLPTTPGAGLTGYISEVSTGTENLIYTYASPNAGFTHGPSYLATDYLASKLYTPDWGTGTLLQMNEDGSAVTTITYQPFSLGVPFWIDPVLGLIFENQSAAAMLNGANFANGSATILGGFLGASGVCADNLPV
jgi:hypothetical protein